LKILLIDNYDSFTYNIVSLIKGLGRYELSVLFNDEVTTSTAHTFDKIIISPGPSLPSNAGNILSIIENLSPTHAIMGICLGHQAIAEVFGASLQQLEKPCHGFRTHLHAIHDEKLYQHVAPNPQVGLYHSWTVLPSSIQNTPLKVTAVSTEGNIMSLRHEAYDVTGIQFHPESFMTVQGSQILANWLQ
jgi:anthranilate synthase component II